jgi:hypothetical protein
MIEKAFVSGQIAQAIFEEDDKLFIIKAKDAENIMECPLYEESLFFNSDTEIKVFGNIEIEELRKTLIKEKSNFDALYGAVGGFDRNLSEKTRILSIQRAESLIKDPGIFDFVTFRLFGNPVPKTAALKKAVKLSMKNDFQEMHSIYKKLLNNGNVIEYILSIFRDAIFELSLETEFVVIKNVFITSGIFAKLLLNITTTTKGPEGLEKIVNKFSDNDYIKEKIPSIWTILGFMESKIENKFIENSNLYYDDDLGCLVKTNRQASWLITEEFSVHIKGVSFIKMKDQHYENKKGETDKPTTSKKQKCS